MVALDAADRIRSLARRWLNYREDGPERRQHFLRRGRGVSFHEFELARVGPAGAHAGFYQEDLDLILRK